MALGATDASRPQLREILAFRETMGSSSTYAPLDCKRFWIAREPWQEFEARPLCIHTLHDDCGILSCRAPRVYLDHNATAPLHPAARDSHVRGLRPLRQCLFRSRRRAGSAGLDRSRPRRSGGFCRSSAQKRHFHVRRNRGAEFGADAPCRDVRREIKAVRPALGGRRRTSGGPYGTPFRARAT